MSAAEAVLRWLVEGGLATGAVLGTTPETWVDTDQIPAVGARDATSDDRTAQTTQTEKERHD